MKASVAPSLSGNGATMISALTLRRVLCPSSCPSGHRGGSFDLGRV